jgi:outer membrane protein TolC
VSQDTPLKPTTEANPVGLKLDGGELADRAIANRMELLELELQLAIDQSEIGFRRNAALPLFLLDYGYDIQGTGTEVHNAYGDLGDSDSFNIGLRAEIPMSNDVAESRLNSAILTRVQRLATREARRLAIRTEVFDALDATTQTWQRILAARLEALLAARTLLAEQRQFDVGLRTSVEVLDASARLADAQSREVIALAAYQNALVDIAFATGTSLGSARIRWEPFGFDELPELERLPEAKEPATRGGFTVEQPAASSAPAASPQPTGAEGAVPGKTPATAGTSSGG